MVIIQKELRSSLNWWVLTLKLCGAHRSPLRHLNHVIKMNCNQTLRLCRFFLMSAARKPWPLGLGINGMTPSNTKLPQRPDTIWLGNIPFAVTLAMLSHALQIMGAMYYLCFTTSEGTEGCILPQSKCEITKHVTTGSAEVQSYGGSSW